jgi:hypothetical protein
MRHLVTLNLRFYEKGPFFVETFIYHVLPAIVVVVVVICWLSNAQF